MSDQRKLNWSAIICVRMVSQRGVSYAFAWFSYGVAQVSLTYPSESCTGVSHLKCACKGEDRTQSLHIESPNIWASLIYSNMSGRGVEHQWMSQLWTRNKPVVRSSHSLLLAGWNSRSNPDATSSGKSSKTFRCPLDWATRAGDCPSLLHFWTSALASISTFMAQSWRSSCHARRSLRCFAPPSVRNLQDHFWSTSLEI